jgi:hypothetical protein
VFGLVLGVMACRGGGIQDQGGYLQNGPKKVQSERVTKKQEVNKSVCIP